MIICFEIIQEGLGISNTDPRMFKVVGLHIILLVLLHGKGCMTSSCLLI